MPHRTRRSDSRSASRPSQEMFDTLEPRRLLSTFTVMNTNDSGAGSLRQAVADANAAAGADIIEFDASLQGATITLASGFIQITDALTIRGVDSDGNRLGISVSTSFTSRHFVVSDGNGASDFVASISDLTLHSGVSAGTSGGSISNAENLTLDRMTFTANSATGGASGGAIQNGATLTIRNSYFGDNFTTGDGGAINNDGRSSALGEATLTIINSTFFNNSANQSGGAIMQNGRGLVANLIIQNSTIISNKADADLGNTADHVGGGIKVFSTGTFTMISTIVAGNINNGATPDEINLGDGFTPFTPATNNLIQDAGTAGGLTDGTDGNIVGQNPMLSANAVIAGGPTRTVLILPGSPAIDAGADPLGLSNDQRGSGFLRVSGDGIDIGAFEMQSISLVVDANADTDDGLYGASQLTLREALVITNNNPGADTITFDNALSGSTITLIGGQFFIADALTLTGPGSGNLTVDGAAASRVFLVDDFDYTTNSNVSISGLTIQNGALSPGSFGAGIANEDDLTLTDVVVTNNTLTNGARDRGAGIYSGNRSSINNDIGASLTLVRSTVNNNSNGIGTGIYSLGNLTITDSTVSGNTAEDNAGGLWFAGVTMSITGSTFSGNATGAESGFVGGGIILTGVGVQTITNSVISGNTATEDGGGLVISVSSGANIVLSNSTISGNTSGTRGGGIVDYSGLVTISNSTISGNTAATGGGGIAARGFSSMTITNSTIAFNTTTGGAGGGIETNFNPITLTSTIVSNNTSGTSTPDDIALNGGAITPSSSFNLIGDATTSGGLTDGTNNNIVGQDPLLEPLANNGGPTQTHALMAGSPAIDTGAAFSSLTTDQRGGLFARLDNGTPDIGAYERQVLALVVDTTESTDDGDVSAGDISLREAIIASNGNPLDDSITFDASLNGSTITITDGFITITDDVTITGPGFSDLTISGNDATRHFVVNDSDSSSTISVTISGLTLTNGMTTANGGAISNDEDLTLDTMKIVHNTSANDGGAILNRNILTIISTIISNNTAGDSGGAIDNDGTTTVTVTGSSIKNNTAGGSSGAIDNDANGTLTITSSGISDNTTGSNGGAIDNNGTLIIANATLSGNTSTDNANGFGGAIQNTANGTLTITNSTLNNNSGVSSGGAIENRGTATITDSTLDGNSAADSGGAIDNFGGTLTVTSSTLSNNTADGSGGAIWTDTTLTIQSSTISGNSAGDFGGGIGMFDGTVVIANSTIANNTADANDDNFGQGGGIDVGKQAGAGTLTTTSTIYAGNLLGTATPTANDITLTNGTVSGSNNLITDAGTAGGLSNGTNANLVGVDPKLGELEDNGGPTRTHAIYPGSPALNTGTASGAVANDQRGQTRTQGSSPDIGAYEWVPTANFPLKMLNGSTSQATSIAGDTQINVIRNTDGDLIAFAGNGSVWTAARIRDYAASPAVTGDPVVWTDPNDGLVYVAAPSADGFILHRRAADGTWTFTNLTAETSTTNADSPQGVLTFFITRPNSGNAAVAVAGITASGEIVAFQQTTAAGSTQASWTFFNISDDLASQSMTTPAFTQMTSYVTSWNQWTLAGLDASGNVQGVWVNVASFTTWRVDNLSTLTGADPLAGELDVTLTPWGGIRFVGVDAGGQLIGTWWNPGRGAGNWTQTDMSATVQGAVPAIVGGYLTAWFTPTNIINYAGYDSAGALVRIHWRPGNPVWNTDTLTDFVTDNQTRPTGSLAAHVSDAGTVNVLAADSNDNLVRLWSADGENDTFSLDILSDLAIRI